MESSPPPAPTTDHPRLTPWRITAIYVVFAVAWLLASGPLISRVVDDPDQLPLFRAIEGSIFILASAGLVLALSYRGILSYRRVEAALRQRHLELDRELAERHEESERLLVRYRAVLNSTLDPLITINAEGTVLEASPALEGVFGWTPEALIGQNIRTLMPEPYASEHDGHLAAYRETGIATIIGRPRELSGQRRDGSIFPLEIMVWRVDVPGNTHPLFTGILRDITLRREAEEQLRRYREHLETMVEERTHALEATHERLRLTDRLATIGTLAAGLGHDMNNVLLPVRCRLDALDVETLTPTIRDHVDAVRSSVEYLQQLTDGLHLMARNPDDQDAAGGRTDPDSWWRSVEPLLTKAIRRGTELTVDFPEGLPTIAVAPHRLTQAVLNLVVNAGEAINDGGTVCFRATVVDHGSTVRLEVSDDGHGMTAEVRRRALDPFYTTKTRGLGTGLGLALVHGTMTAAGGEMDISSAPGEGTVVVLDFPVVSEHPRKDGQLERTARITTADSRVGSMISALLAATGFVAEAGDDLPPATDLWITDAIGDRLDAAAEYLAIPERRVIALNPPDDASTANWKRIGALIVPESDAFESLRDTISLATSAADTPPPADHS